VPGIEQKWKKKIENPAFAIQGKKRERERKEYPAFLTSVPRRRVTLGGKGEKDFHDGEKRKKNNS